MGKEDSENMHKRKQTIPRHDNGNNSLLCVSGAGTLQEVQEKVTKENSSTIKRSYYHNTLHKYAIHAYA